MEEIITVKFKTLVHKKIKMDEMINPVEVSSLQSKAKNHLIYKFLLEMAMQRWL